MPETLTPRNTRAKEPLINSAAHLTVPFFDICHLQISRFTSSKPSKSAIASVEKITRQLTTSFNQRFAKGLTLRRRECRARKEAVI